MLGGVDVQALAAAEYTGGGSRVKLRLDGIEVTGTYVDPVKAKFWCIPQ